MDVNDPLVMARLGLALLERLAPDDGGPGRVLLVSSAGAGDGKSFVAALLHGALRAQCAGAVGLADGRALAGAAATALFQPLAVRQALQALRERQRLTIVDGPSLPESGALVQEADALLLVVDGHASSKRGVERALTAARVDRQRVAGLVLNRREAPLPRWLGGA